RNRAESAIFYDFPFEWTIGIIDRAALKSDKLAGWLQMHHAMAQPSKPVLQRPASNSPPGGGVSMNDWHDPTPTRHPSPPDLDALFPDQKGTTFACFQTPSASSSSSMAARHHAVLGGSPNPPVPAGPLLAPPGLVVPQLGMMDYNPYGHREIMAPPAF
ncbi:hypothetical protein PENTCL1PPCAC_15892, partial [Pristionchus entomophagus]